MPQARFLTCGDTALTVEFGDRIDPHLSALVIALGHRIDEARIDGVVETVPTLRSLMVHYDPLRVPHAQLKSLLTGLLDGLQAADSTGRIWHIPVCYDPSLGPDLADVAARTGISVADVIALHSGETYRSYMLGFLPGQPYMGNLPERLMLPRRENPRVKVPLGSVAIAMAMTVIYALESPGGWHILGRTPVRLWDMRREEPALLSPGDQVKFEPVSLAEYGKLMASAEAGTLQVEPGRMPVAETTR